MEFKGNECCLFEFPEEKCCVQVGYFPFIQHTSPILFEDLKVSDETFRLRWPKCVISSPELMPARVSGVIWDTCAARILAIGNYDDMKTAAYNLEKFGFLVPPAKRSRKSTNINKICTKKKKNLQKKVIGNNAKIIKAKQSRSLMEEVRNKNKTRDSEKSLAEQGEATFVHVGQEIAMAAKDDVTLQQRDNLNSSPKADIPFKGDNLEELDGMNSSPIADIPFKGDNLEEVDGINSSAIHRHCDMEPKNSEENIDEQELNEINLRSSRKVLRLDPYDLTESGDSSEFEFQKTNSQMAFEIARLKDCNKNLRHELTMTKAMLTLKEDLPQLITTLKSAAEALDYRVAGCSSSIPIPMAIHKPTSTSKRLELSGPGPIATDKLKRSVPGPAGICSQFSPKIVKLATSSPIVTSPTQLTNKAIASPAIKPPDTPSVIQESSMNGVWEGDLNIKDMISDIRRCCCNHKKPSLLVCDLLCAVFSSETLATSSITGLKSNTSGIEVQAKRQLDPKKLAAIIDYVTQVFPEVNKPKLLGVIRNKLKNVASRK